MAQRDAMRVEHVRPSRPVIFPSDPPPGETERHAALRRLLCDALETELRGRACVGSRRFVYWHAADPSRVLLPDVFVRLGAAQEAIDAWKMWERGAPQVCVEIVSDADTTAESWDTKLRYYHQLGVAELVRFDPEAEPGRRLRVWDRLEEVLVERVVGPDEVTPALLLDLFWVVAPARDLPAALRLARDDAKTLILPTAT